MRRQMRASNRPQARKPVWRSHVWHSRNPVCCTGRSNRLGRSPSSQIRPAHCPGRVAGKELAHLIEVAAYGSKVVHDACAMTLTGPAPHMMLTLRRAKWFAKESVELTAHGPRLAYCALASRAATATMSTPRRDSMSGIGWREVGCGARRWIGQPRSVEIDRRQDNTISRSGVFSSWLEERIWHVSLQA
jgi:hypothetical protein